MKEVEMNSFYLFSLHFLSICLIFIDFETNLKERKENEKHNECLMTRRTS